MSRDVETYSAEIDAGDLGEEPCVCSNCNWKGAASLLSEIGDCGLTPGDASPAGRCPDCDCVAYLNRPEDRAESALRRLIWTRAQGYPAGDANLKAAVDAFTEAFAAAVPGCTIVNVTTID